MTGVLLREKDICAQTHTHTHGRDTGENPTGKWRIQGSQGLLATVEKLGEKKRTLSPS